MTPRSATPSHLKKRASAWAARVADAVYGVATCGEYGRLQQEATWLQNASVAAEATLLRLQLEAATTEQAAVEATRAHELRLLELRDQPEARRVLHEERMAAEQTRRMRIEAEERAAAREREARAERDKVAMQLWSEAQREVYDRVVEGHTRLYERVVAEAASGYTEVEGGQLWSGLTDAWFGKRLIPIAQALKLPKTRRRAAEELQRIVDFRMRLQGLMAPGEQLRQVAPGSALLALTDGGDSSAAVSSPSPPLPPARPTAAAAIRLGHAGGGEAGRAPTVVDVSARSKAPRTVESVRLADVGLDVARAGGETPRDLATPRHLATPDAADGLPAGEGESVEDELEVEANEALQSLLAETCPSPLQGARHSMSDGGRFGEPQGFVVC